MSRTYEPCGTITPFHNLHKVGLAVADPPVVKPVQKWAGAKARLVTRASRFNFEIHLFVCTF